MQGRHRGLLLFSIVGLLPGLHSSVYPRYFAFYLEVMISSTARFTRNCNNFLPQLVSAFRTQSSSGGQACKYGGQHMHNA